MLRSQMQSIDQLVYRNRFAGQGRFFDLQGGTFYDPSVRGNGVAGFQNHHITGNQLVGMQYSQLAIPQHLAGGGGHSLQRFNGRFCFALLHNTQHRVEQHHDQDDTNFHQPFCQMTEVTGLGQLQKVQHGGGCRNHRCDHQNDQHRVLQLCKKTLQPGGFFCLLQLVGAVFLQT